MRPTWFTPLVALVLVVGLGACSRFDRYNSGTAQLWIGSPLLVERECRKRDPVSALAIYPRLLGCTDFARSTIISVDDPKVIAHEFCHWTRKTASHQECPPP
jgi:hypothetical protein